MWTLSIKPLRKITVQTKDLNTHRKLFTLQPNAKIPVSNLFSFFISTSTNMVKRKKLYLFFATTSTTGSAVAIVSQHF